MGIHSREREVEELKENYIKKSSCILLVVMALLVGSFIGNTVTMLYLAQQNVPTGQNVAAPSQQPETHVADPKALAALEAETVTDPTNAAAWVNLGNFCFDHDLYQKAVTAYEHALELSPMQIGVWSDLGVMYRRTKQYDKAVEAFSQAATLDPKHVTSRFNMGIVYLHDLKDKENAVKAWKQVLALDPDAKSPTGQSVADLVRGLE